MTADHDPRPECAAIHGEFRAEINNLREDTKEHRAEYKELRTLITESRDATYSVRAEIVDLKSSVKVQARAWAGAIALFISLIAALVGAAFR